MRSRRFIIFSLSLSSVLLVILIVLVLGSGCEKKKEGLSVEASKRKPRNPQVESVKLAEAILWPKPYRFSVSGDPFKPLIYEPSLEQADIDELLSHPDIKINIFGILKMGDESIALLELPSGVSLVREEDKVGKYTVKSITPNKVILESDGESKILELGGEE